MKKAFVRTPEFTSNFPEDLATIRKYLKQRGKLNITDGQLDDAYREFCDDKYDANWLNLNDDILDEFSCHLETIDAKSL